MSTQKKCIIAKYDETIKSPPFLTIKLDECVVEEPEEDNLGVRLAFNLRHACWEKGYEMKFYTTSKEEGYDYEIVVYPEL